jgi:outer membrane protein OmpA-like peptidoglycan-associated protein
MPLTKADVLNTLSDPHVSQMDFWVSNIHVHGGAFANIRDLVLDDNIEVVSGTNSVNAYYNAASDTLTTQNVNSPPDLNARALLLHECAHALVDLAEIDVTDLTNEVTAYIAQHAYILLSSSTWTVGANNGPWTNFYQDVVGVVKNFKLDKPEGRGAVIKRDDIEFLRTQLPKLPGDLYSHLKDATKAHSNGVKVRHFVIRGSPEPLTIKSSSAAKDDSLVELQGDILFDFDRAAIKPSAEPELHRAAAVIRMHLSRALKGSVVQVDGHTDNVGSRAYNQGLSERRAQAVADWLVNRKYVTKDQVRVEGWGSERPKVPNTSRNGRAKNRRVEFVIFKR